MFSISIENLKTLKYHILSKKHLTLFIVFYKCGNEYEKRLKEESIKKLKVLGLINNIEDHQKIYCHVWRKHKSRI